MINPDYYEGELDPFTKDTKRKKKKTSLYEREMKNIKLKNNQLNNKREKNMEKLLKDCYQFNANTKSYMMNKNNNYKRIYKRESS